MAEWSIAAVLKTVVPRGTRGSNPCLSAEHSEDHCLMKQICPVSCPRCKIGHIHFYRTAISPGPAHKSSLLSVFVMNNMFNSLIVRLRLAVGIVAHTQNLVSIPYSTIKMELGRDVMIIDIGFQFLIVRLKLVYRSNNNTNAKFQFLIV